MKQMSIEATQASSPQAFFPSMLVLQGNDSKEIERLVQPLRAVQHVEGILVITSSDEVFAYASEHSLHAAHETNDPLSNLYAAAKAFDLEVLVCVNSRVEASAVDQALFHFRTHYDELDYAELAGGSLVIMRFDALEEAFYHSKDRVDFAGFLKEHSRSVQFQPI